MNGKKNAASETNSGQSFAACHAQNMDGVTDITGTFRIVLSK